jgi:hypothetical protein
VPFSSANDWYLAIAEAQRRPNEPRIEDRVTMSVGLWVILAIGAYLALSLAFVLVLGAILGRIRDSETALLASAPPEATDDVDERSLSRETVV